MDDEIQTIMRGHTELDQLHELSRALTGVFRVDEVLNTILTTCLKLCRAERGAILLFDTHSSKVVKTLIRSNGSMNEGIDHQLNLVVAGLVYDRKTHYMTDDVLRDLNYGRPSKSARNIGPSIALPLYIAGEIIGVIHLVNTRGGSKFSQETIRLGGIIASLAVQFIDRAKLHDMLFQKNVRLKDALKSRWRTENILGQSRIILDLKEMIPVIAQSTANVLIYGETGTGKELVSSVIHYAGPRADQPFVAINCAAIPAALFESELFGHEKGAFTGAMKAQRGKFELADGGTLFLDEISEMPIELQTKLLRAIEDRRYYPLGSSKEISVNVRIIAACSKNLIDELQAKRFNDALYHRLNVLPIQVPPLRDRQEDIPILAKTFLKEFSSGKSVFDDDALQFLSSRLWIGNVRELKNAVERISIFTDKSVISREDLVPLLISEDSLQSNTIDSGSFYMNMLESGKDKLLEQNEKGLIEMAIHQSDGNVTRAARLLGIDRMALRRRMEKYHL